MCRQSTSCCRLLSLCTLLSAQFANYLSRPSGNQRLGASLSNFRPARACRAEKSIRQVDYRARLIRLCKSARKNEPVIRKQTTEKKKFLETPVGPCAGVVQERRASEWSAFRHKREIKRVSSHLILRRGFESTSSRLCFEMFCSSKPKSAD
jgi:hypothetical protein